MNKKEKRRLLESKAIELNLIQQSTIGIQSGLIAGLIVIISSGIYTTLLKDTGSLIIAFFVGTLIFFTLYYFSVNRPFNKISKEIRILCKK